jgi:hypothetical protein
VTHPKYVIINETDAPEPSMVCQWVAGMGYCYMDRSGLRPEHDGMQGAEATSINAFGFVCVEDRDGMVRFYRTDKPPTATYRDGEPRPWQSKQDSFEFRRLTAAYVRKSTHAD